jgi:hypothetical protein
VSDERSRAAGADDEAVPAGRSVPGGLAALAVAVVLAVLAGPPGAVAGAVVLASWYVLGSLYAFAVGQVAVVAFVGDWPVVYLAMSEAAAFAVLVAPDVATARGRRLAVGTVLVSGLVGIVAYGAMVTWEMTWVTAVVLLGVAGVVVYGLHRYELVATGAVDARVEES